MLVRTLRKSAVLRALLYGALSGVFGVVLFILLLKMPTQFTEGELLQIDQQQAVEQVQFFARQYGVYSTQEGAAAFMATAPSLNKAAIVQVGEQYFIWGSVARARIEGKPTVPSSFSKAFLLESSCPQQAFLQLPHTLQDDKWLKNNFETEERAMLPEDWTALIPEVQKLSEDTDVVRLHVLNHYYAQVDCLKITF